MPRQTNKNGIGPKPPDATTALTPEEELLRAKIRFLKAADDVAPLGFVERRPLTSVGIAFILGSGISALGLSTKVPSILTNLVQFGEIVSQSLRFMEKVRS